MHRMTTTTHSCTLYPTMSFSSSRTGTRFSTIGKHTRQSRTSPPSLESRETTHQQAAPWCYRPATAASGWTYAEILICGGSEFGAFKNPSLQLPASQTCGRILPLATNPAWVMENMPMTRNMGDMVLLPTRQVLIINGAENGSQGWGFATNAVLNPVLYNPGFAAGTRFQTMTATTIPRVYHSTANLLPDGRILVAGSNTHQFYTFTQPFPTELRIEAYSPASSLKEQLNPPSCPPLPPSAMANPSPSLSLSVLCPAAWSSWISSVLLLSLTLILR